MKLCIDCPARILYHWQDGTLTHQVPLRQTGDTVPPGEVPHRHAQTFLGRDTSAVVSVLVWDEGSHRVQELFVNVGRHAGCLLECCVASKLEKILLFYFDIYIHKKKFGVLYCNWSFTLIFFFIYIKNAHSGTDAYILLWYIENSFQVRVGGGEEVIFFL